MKKRRILALIPLLGLFLTGCDAKSVLSSAKQWISQNIYHPIKDLIDGKSGEEQKPSGGEEQKPAEEGGKEEGSGEETVVVTGVTISKSSLNLTTESEDVTLTATVAPAKASQEVSWSVAPEGVVTVNAGKVHVVAAGEAVITATSVADATKKATCTVKVTEPGTQTGGDGSEANPYSVTEALTAFASLESGQWSDGRVYIQGLVSEYNSTTNVYTLYGDETSSFVVYKPTSALAEGVVVPVVGDVAVFEGLVENYNGTFELTGNSKDTDESHKVYPTIQKIVSRGTSTISLDPESSENATVTFEATATNASQYTFTVAPAEGHVVTAVQVNGAYLDLTEGEYTITILGNVVIHVDTVAEGTEVKTFQKATSIAVGDKVVLVCEGVNKYLSEFSTGSTVFGMADDVPATFTAAKLELTVVAGTDEDSFAFQMSDESYLNWSSGNSLNKNATLSKNTSWKVTIDEDGNAAILNANDAARQIWWNVSSPRFACYTGKTAGTSYYSVQLYSLQ